MAETGFTRALKTLQCEKDEGRVATKATEIPEFMLMPQLVNKIHLLVYVSIYIHKYFMYLLALIVGRCI